MRNEQINWRRASKRDVQNDFERLLNYYNFDIANKNATLSLDEIQNLGVNLEGNTTTAIKNTKFSQLHDAIIFYSRSPQCDVKELMRHFKNIVSHPENIKKAKLNGIKYYKIQDYDLHNKKFTMKGVVSTEVWKVFISKIIRKISNNLNIS